MTRLTKIDPEYLQSLILKFRAVMAEVPDNASDDSVLPDDDEITSPLADVSDNLVREELIEEIQGLDPTHQNELVALMWLGRGDAEPEEWPKLLKMAVQQHDVPTEDYLLDHPLVAEYLADGIMRLSTPDQLK